MEQAQKQIEQSLDQSLMYMQQAEKLLEQAIETENDVEKELSETKNDVWKRNSPKAKDFAFQETGWCCPRTRPRRRQEGCLRRARSLLEPCHTRRIQH